MIANSKPFAWQGVSLRIPQDWDLGALEGDYKEGYFRLDDPEDVRLEVRWKREKKKVDLGTVLKNYLDNLQTQAKRKKLAFLSLKPREEFTKIYLKDKEVKFFSWKTDSQGGLGSSGETLGLISQCNRCHTILITQTIVKEKDASLIADVLKTLEDHSFSNLLQWAVYDFMFSIPETLTLDKCSLKSGYLEFIFSAITSQIKIRRWGLAHILLKEVILEQWARGIAPKILKNRINSSCRRDEEKHEVLSCDVRRWKWHAFYARHCKEVNKLYAVDYTGKKDEKLFQEIYSKIQCH